MHVLIVDDELLARNRLRVLLSECEEPASPFVIEEAASTAQALEFLQRSPIPVNILFLDVQMPGPNGLVLAQTVRSMSKPPAVVFVTAHAMYAANAFELEATDYLTKPVRLERLQQTLAKIRRIRALEGLGDATVHLPALVIRDRGRAERVPLHQIIYFKAEQKYVTVRTASRTYIYDNSLSELENRFPSQFVRIHRNALVAPSQMRALDKHYTDDDMECWVLRLHSVPETLQVSRRQLASVRHVLHSMSHCAATPQAEPA